MGDKTRTRRVLKGLAVGLITGLLGALFGLTNLGVEFERSVGLTWLFNMRGTISPPPEVVVVAIGGQTGKDLGLPSLPRDWPRSIHARLVEELTKQGATAIVFDMQFDKPKVAADDRAFVSAVDKADRVVLIELVTGRGQPIFDQGGQQTGSVWVEELIQPMPALVKSAKGLATFPLPKIDAAVYEFWVFKESVGDAPTLPAVALQVHALQVYPAWLSLLEQVAPSERGKLPGSSDNVGKATQVRALMASSRRVFENDALAWERFSELIEQGAQDRTVDEQKLLKALRGLYSGNAHRMLNFYGPPGTIKTIPYQAVIQGKDPKQGGMTFDLKGKTVFVGFSDLYDPGQPDRFYTVFTGENGVDLSGVEIAATAFGNLLTDQSVKPASSLLILGLLLVFGVTIGAIAYFFPAMLGVPLTILLAVAYAVWAQWLFNTEAHWVPLATPLLAQLPLALFLGLMGQYLLERRRGQRISKALSYYVPEGVALDLTNNQSKPDAFNKVVYGTCFATDMSGFSTIAEQLPPDKLAIFLNDYFDTLAQSLKRHQVDVTEFRADAIMCAWTADSPNIEVRRKAVLAALDASEAIGEFKQRHPLLKASLRVGLEAGNFYIGHAGGGGHFVFSIVGDNANTASRIEGLNKHIGTQILATETVVDGLEGLLLRPVGAFQFVGKTEALPIVEIVSTQEHATDRQKRLCTMFSDALSLYKNAQWAQSTLAFEAILRDFADDGPSRFYLARSESYQGGAEAPEEPSTIQMSLK